MGAAGIVSAESTAPGLRESLKDLFMALIGAKESSPDKAIPKAFPSRSSTIAPALDFGKLISVPSKMKEEMLFPTTIIFCLYYHGLHSSFTFYLLNFLNGLLDNAINWRGKRRRRLLHQGDRSNTRGNLGGKKKQKSKQKKKWVILV